MILKYTGKRYRDEYREAKKRMRDKDDRVRRIQGITLTVLLLEFVFIAIGILIFGLKQNFIVLVVAVGVFILTVILGANEKTLRYFYIKICINCSKRKIKAFGRIIDDKLIQGTTVNGELTKVMMEFRFKVDGKRYTGYKILKIKKLRKGKDFKNDDTYVERLTSFNVDLEENGAGLNILYIPDKKYCYICDQDDYVFNYFITDVLYAEDIRKKIG